MGWLTSLKKNWFLEGIVLVILLAKLWPEIGAKGGESFSVKTKPLLTNYYRSTHESKSYSDL